MFSEERAERLLRHYGGGCLHDRLMSSLGGERRHTDAVNSQEPQENDYVSSPSAGGWARETARSSSAAMSSRSATRSGTAHDFLSTESVSSASRAW